MAYVDMERQRVYWVLKEMQRRCSPQAQPGDLQRYFLRGIRVDPRWCGRGGLANFLEDMGPRPTPLHEIDRRDGNGDYCKANCRWVTHAQQMANRRPRSTVYQSG